jgi:tRNA nucleotidyltransferase (CCA-adding enzyme)
MDNIDAIVEQARNRMEASPDEDTEDLDWFLVGGAVRDAMRGIQPHDFDFVVVGENAESMKERGFMLVDNDGNDTFPVFVNQAGDEVALARTEENSGDGHKGFDISIEGVSLEEDLERRDLTINAMALAPDGSIIDPHDGHADLQRGVIRHVSDAFLDDPLRVLRAARFAARMDAVIATETAVIMRDLAPEMADLPKERLRMELEKALVQGDPPSKFFKVLASVDALEVAFPRIAHLRDIPAGPPEHHEEGSAFNHTMLVLDEMNDIRPDDELALLMALAHDVGKLKTPEDKLPAHHGHGKEGLDVIEEMASRLRFSNEQVRAMKEASRQHMRLKNIEEMNVATVFDTFKRLNHTERMAALMCADAWGREPEGHFRIFRFIERSKRTKRAIERVSGEDLIEEGITPEELGGEEFGDRLRDRRIEEMHAMRGKS